MKKFLLPLFLFALIAATGSSQTREQLEADIRKAQQEIEATDALLKKTEADQANNWGQLRLVQNNITNRKKIVSDLDRQISLTNREIDEKNQTVTELKNELELLKQEYTEMIRSGYKNYRTNNIMSFIFASKDFSDMARRIYYIRRYSLAREQKAAAIDSVSVILAGDLQILDSTHYRLDSTKQFRNTELQKLGQEESKYRNIDNSLKSKAMEYNNKLKARRKNLDNLQAQVEKIIAEEARKAQAANSTMTEAEKETLVRLSGRFDENKGKLPYPVSGGVIVDRFGQHKDPNNPNVTIDNQGITIAAEKGAAVRTVFEGEVTRIFMLGGMNNAVIIQHGYYYTVYSNLETVNVKKGDKVSTNQQIGRIYSGPNPESHFLHFSLWSKETKHNPEPWLKR